MEPKVERTQVVNPYNDAKVRLAFRNKVIGIFLVLCYCSWPGIYLVLTIEWYRERMQAMPVVLAFMVYALIDFLQMFYPTTVNTWPRNAWILVVQVIALYGGFLKVLAQATNGVQCINSFGAGILVHVCSVLIVYFIPYDLSVLWIVQQIFFGISFISFIVYKVIYKLYYCCFGFAIASAIISSLLSWQSILHGNRVRVYYEPQHFAIAAVLLYSDMLFIVLSAFKIQQYKVRDDIALIMEWQKVLPEYKNIL